MNPGRFISFFIVFCLLACKDTNKNPSEDQKPENNDELSSTPGWYAADGIFLRKNAEFFFYVWDDSFTRRLDELPESGEVPGNKRPYSGGYYPESGGGTDVVMVGNQSPLAKYDQAFHEGRNLAVTWERENHTSGPKWAGHCNGFAATAQRYPKEPSKVVVRNGVSFDPKDVKALLAELHMSVDYEFLGGNRCENSVAASSPDARSDPSVMGECEDINPGTMHAAVTNWIGRMRHTLIVDKSRGEEIWNYPLYKYQITSINRNISEAQARQYITPGQQEYIFNPGAERFAYVEMTLTHAEASRGETLGRLSPVDIPLSYVLELNGEGEIIGGEWVGASLQKHPDFLWVALAPQTPNGTRFMGNPHIEEKEVIRLWSESVGSDPEVPPLGLQRPNRDDNWGRFPNFEVTIDGNQRGAVFAGKKAVLEIQRRNALAASGLELEVRLNANLFKKEALGADPKIRYEFEAGLGLSRFQFVWRKEGAQIEEQFLRFHVVR